MLAKLKVVFVTPLWGTARTGPEVYAKYLWESFRDDPEIEFHLVAGGEGESHPRLHLVKPPAGSLALYRAVAQRALELTGELGPHGILHVNNSSFHQSLLGSHWPIVGQVNDYEAARFGCDAWSILRQHGPRKMLAIWRRHLLERRFVRRQAITLCNSEFTREEICSAYGVHGPRIRVAYKAVDVEKFIPPGGVLEARRERVDKTVLFIGTNFHIKGLDVLVRAMGQLGAGARLRVVGADLSQFEKRFPRLLEPVRGRVEFLGAVARDKIPPLLWSADVFCLPSRMEALGVALLEAIAAGLPCVASDVGGIPEIARRFPSVRLVPPESPDALADAIRQALRDGAVIVDPHAIRLHFGRESMIRGVRQLYQELST